MKTLEFVKSEINRLVSSHGNGLSLNEIPPEPEKEKKRLERKRNKDRKELEFLNGVKIYLESNPSKEFVSEEEARVKARIESVKRQWLEINKDGKLSTDAMNDFYEERNTKKLKKQFRMLNYILS